MEPPAVIDREGNEQDWSWLNEAFGQVTVERADAGIRSIFDTVVVIIVIGIIILLVIISSSIYSIEANERGVVQRFGDRLQRVPAGYPKDHPAAEELKYKDWGVWVPLKQSEVLAPDALARAQIALVDPDLELRF